MSDETDPQNSNPTTGHGREASRPREIPPIGWKDIAFRTWDQIVKDRVGFAAAGVAFYLLFSLVPGLVALISIYGLVADPADVGEQITSLQGVVPSDTITLIEKELIRITSQDRSASWSLLVGVMVALWSGSKAMTGLVTGLNIAYGEAETRNFFYIRLLVLALTLGSILFVGIVLSLLVALPIVLGHVPGIADHSKMLISILRWPVLGLVIMIWLSILYRIAPNRRSPRWVWIPCGSILAVIIWFTISIGLTIYAANFADFQKTYGSLGAICLLLLWFYGFGWAVLAGAELNAEIERQTAKDSTVGPPKPIGDRGAHAADTLGEFKD